MKLKNSDIIKVWNSLEKVRPSPPIPRSFVFWRSKTKLALEPVIKSLQEAGKVDEVHWKSEIEARRKEVIKTAEKYAVLDANGTPAKLPNGEYIIGDQTAYNEAMEEIIKIQFTDLWEEEERVKKEYEKLLNEESDVVVKMIKADQLPEQFEALEATDGLFILVDE